MITIKEIICLVNNYGLKNARFIPGNGENTSIEVKDGVAYFKQPCVENQLLSKLSKEDVDVIDKENDYYIKEVWDELMVDS